MVQLLIIADDLTGAADTGVQFSKRGIPTLVAVDHDIDMTSVDHTITVLAVDAETRHRTAVEAADRVEKVVRQAAACGVTHFYKKTDSTLRGNVGAELEAVMKAVNCDRLMFIPAYPKTGRFTRRGYQYVGEDLLHTTAFGQDPREPVEVSSVPSIIAKQSNVASQVLSPRSDRAGEILVTEQEGICVFDCESDEDLMRIGQLLADHDALGVLAGSAGFAELLPELLNLPRGPLRRRRNDQPILLVNGSVNEVSLGQVAFARQNDFAEITAPPSLVFANGPRRDSEVEVIAEKAALECGRTKDVLLQTIKRRDELDGYVVKNSPNPAQIKKMFRLAAGNIGRLAARILTEGKFGNCVVFGGDTAVEVIKALGRSRLLLGEEIIPGLALAELVGLPRHVNFITKAGGFGPEDVVCRIRDFLRKDS